MKKLTVPIITVLVLLLVSGFVPHQHTIKTAGTVYRKDGAESKEHTGKVDITVKVKHSFFFPKSPYGEVSISVPNQDAPLEYSVTSSKIYSNDEYYTVQIRRAKGFALDDVGAVWIDKASDTVVIATEDIIISNNNNSFLEYVIANTPFD